MAHSNGIFWNRFLRTPLFDFEKTPLEARNRVQSIAPPPIRYDTIIVVYIDEARPVYYPDGDVTFNSDLQDYIDWKNDLSEINLARIFDPMVNRVEANWFLEDPLDVGGIIPSSELFPTDDFMEFGLIGRSEGVANYTLVPQFRNRFIQYVNNRVFDIDTVIKAHFLIDNSGSMHTTSIEPGFMVPDHNGESVRQIIEDEYGKEFEFASFGSERWIKEILDYLKGL